MLEKEILSDGEETDSGSWNHKLYDLLVIEFANYLIVDSKPAEEHYASGGQDTSNYKFSQENGIAFAWFLYDAKANG